ncbi:MAG: hypothetical protein EZS28_046645, partial [Streblomastix strix]
LRSEITAPLLLNVAELGQESNIVISDVHVNRNTAGTQAQAGIVFVHTSEIQDDPSTRTILLIENSEIVQNTLAPIQESCAIQIEGLNPQQILIKNSTINNRSPPNNNNTYEIKFILPYRSISQNLIDQFQIVDFAITLNPVAVKVLPSEQFDYLILPLIDEYANIQVNSNGQESCSSYIANFHNDIQSIGCAVVIIRLQDNLGLFKGRQRSVSITDLTISFRGTNFQTQANIISFKPNLLISNDPIDSSLFRIHDGGLVTLTNLFVSRSNQIGSENAPIAVIISRVGKQSNELQKNAAGQLVINNSILEGGNSASSNVWYNLGLAETCNVGYGAAIVADGQTIVQISGSTFRTFEGPAVRALNGA